MPIGSVLRPSFTCFFASLLLFAAPLDAQTIELNVAAAEAGATAVTDAPFSHQGQTSTQYAPEKAIDGDRASPASRWISHQSREPHYLEVQFAEPRTIHRIVAYPDYPASTHRYGTEYVLQHWDGGAWKNVHVRSLDASERRLAFDITPVTTQRIRYQANRTDGAGYVKLFELEAYATVEAGPDVRPLTFRDYPNLPYPLEGEPLRLTGWKAKGGDDPAFAAPDFDDSGWREVRVGESVVPQIGAHRWVWYRVSFDLPEAFADRDLLLDLGRVSVYDEVFVNGEAAGSYGTPPPTLIFGASGVYRKYPISASMLRPGRNTIAIRVAIGHRGGLDFGRYTLQPLQRDTLLARMALKSDEPADSLLNLLSDVEHLNHFAPGGDLLVKPDLLKLFGEPLTGGELTATVFRGDEALNTQSASLSVEPGAWNGSLFRFQAPDAVGVYRCDLTYTIDGREYWSRSIPFAVVDPAEVVRFDLPVDEGLKALGSDAFPADVSGAAIGRYGPRHYTPERFPVDDFTGPDARAGVTMSARISNADEAPLMFMTNIRPVPEGSAGRFHRAAGHQYDGLDDAWLLGKVVIGDQLDRIEATESSWVARNYRYTYADGHRLDFRLSTVSPAILVDTDASAIRWLDGLARHGIGLPTRLAYERDGKLVVVDAAEGVDGRRMTANYILAWFHGAGGWDEFDIPLLFVLESRPDTARVESGSLRMVFSGAAKRVQVMPLFGVTLQTPASTQGWAEGVPSEVAERCRYWSRVLVSAPAGVERHAGADYDGDRVVVRDRFHHLDIQDAWGTRGIRLAPLNPTLPLAAAAGNIPIAVSEPVSDLGLATLYGPYVAAQDAAEIRFSAGDLLHLVREVREVTPAPEATLGAYRSELNRLVAEYLDEELTTRPWDRAIRGGKYEPGLAVVPATALYLTLPYLDPPLRDRLKAELAAEAQLLFETGVADASWRDRLRENLREVPLVTTIQHPVTGLELSFPTYAFQNMAIDAPYYEGLRTYAIWRYVHTFDDDARLRDEWPQVQRFFNTIRNSHDWAIGLSWDSLSGLRLGNGLQESGVMHAAGAAMARLARRVGDPAAEQEAAYVSVISAVAMQAALNATQYITWRRPWTASHSYRHGIEHDLKIAPRRHVEYNALGGFSQFLIGSGTSPVNSPGGYVESPLPEVMRPYQEVWTDYTNDFYHPRRDVAFDRRTDTRITLDAWVYQMTQYPQSVAEVFEFRRSLPDAKVDPHNRITDYRAYLDHLSEVSHRPLW